MPFSIAAAAFFNCDVGYKHWVNNAFGVVLVNNNQHASRWGEGNKVRMFHRHSAPSRQMNHEWPEGFGVAKVFDLLDRHKFNLTE